jgi:hypothetical protein
MLEQLLKNLDSKHAAVRKAAIRQARVLPPDQLLELAQMEALRSRPNWLLIGGKMTATITIPAYVLILALIVSHYLHLFPWLARHDLSWIIRLIKLSGKLYLPLASCLLVPLLLYYRYGRPPHARSSMAAIVDGLDDARLVPLALNLLAHPYAGTQEIAKKALLRLLPQLRAGDADNWTMEQRFTLRVILFDSPVSNIEMTLAVLKALEQVGDERDLPAIRKLMSMTTDSKVMSKSSVMAWQRMVERARHIRQAALECIPYLEIRAEEKKQAQTLLRASEASSTADSERLLRAAEATGSETPAEQLLRPHSPS